MESVAQLQPSLTSRRCLATAARLAQSADRAPSPAARAGLAALALDWLRLARELEGEPLRAAA